LDDASAAALLIVRGDGLTDSEAVRLSLCEAADRRRRRSSLRAEAAALAADPADREEVRIVREFMEELGPDWPE